MLQLGKIYKPLNYEEKKVDNFVKAGHSLHIQGKFGQNISRNKTELIHVYNDITFSPLVSSTELLGWLWYFKKCEWMTKLTINHENLENQSCMDSFI